MNTTRTATFAAASTMFATVICALAMSSTDSQAQLANAEVKAAPVVHELPRVVVTGKVHRNERASIVDLPRVVVTGRRSDTAQALASQADRGAAQGS